MDVSKTSSGFTERGGICKVRKQSLPNTPNYLESDSVPVVHSNVAVPRQIGPRPKPEGGNSYSEHDRLCLSDAIQSNVVCIVEHCEVEIFDRLVDGCITEDERVEILARPDRRDRMRSAVNKLKQRDFGAMKHFVDHISTQSKEAADSIWETYAHLRNVMVYDQKCIWCRLVKTVHIKYVIDYLWSQKLVEDHFYQRVVDSKDAVGYQDDLWKELAEISDKTMSHDRMARSIIYGLNTKDKYDFLAKDLTELKDKNSLFCCTCNFQETIIRRPKTLQVVSDVYSFPSSGSSYSPRSSTSLDSDLGTYDTHVREDCPDGQEEPIPVRRRVKSDPTSAKKKLLRKRERLPATMVILDSSDENLYLPQKGSPPLLPVPASPLQLDQNKEEAVTCMAECRSSDRCINMQTSDGTSNGCNQGHNMHRANKNEGSSNLRCENVLIGLWNILNDLVLAIE